MTLVRQTTALHPRAHTNSYKRRLSKRAAWIPRRSELPVQATLVRQTAAPALRTACTSDACQADSSPGAQNCLCKRRLSGRRQPSTHALTPTRTSTACPRGLRGFPPALRTACTSDACQADGSPGAQNCLCKRRLSGRRQPSTHALTNASKHPLVRPGRELTLACSCELVKLPTSSPPFRLPAVAVVAVSHLRFLHRVVSLVAHTWWGLGRLQETGRILMGGSCIPRMSGGAFWGSC